MKDGWFVHILREYINNKYNTRTSPTYSMLHRHLGSFLIYILIYIEYINLYIYIYIERKKERKKERKRFFFCLIYIKQPCFSFNIPPYMAKSLTKLS